MLKELEVLIKTIKERKDSTPERSYTNKLLNNRTLNIKKIEEEIKELIESVEKDTNKVHEAADVLYHLFVFLEGNDIKIEDVMRELKNRKKNELR
ncbi:MAG: phosphoribosyl-ATP diphosphatase [Pelagibacteraceae bacterium TMED216]|nr:MAG: phosphoribosyl-ATP diphosphatase [Pelagibacteraceae bacterium TMED216]|tara:strand:- start:5372 stop:5656 length:285 start_codon:yes stop_codon:yes gene_type:complete